MELSDKGFTYETFRLTGWHNGERVRKQFKSREEADDEKNCLEIYASNADSGTRAINTRLAAAQVAEAESVVARSGGKSLSKATVWLLENYRAVDAQKAVETAREAFIEDRTPHISKPASRDYNRTKDAFCVIFPARHVHTLKASDVDAFLKAKATGPKRHNNARGDPRRHARRLDRARRSVLGSVAATRRPDGPIARGLS